MILIRKSEKEFQEFYRTHGVRVRRTLQGMVGNISTAEELTQEAFLKAWKNLNSFSFKSSLSTWIYQIAINTALDWLRSHKARWISPDTLEPSSESTVSEVIAESLLELDENQRALLVLHYYEGQNLIEISKILKIPVGTVKSRLHAAKANLRPLLITKGFNV